MNPCAVCSGPGRSRREIEGLSQRMKGRASIATPGLVARLGEDPVRASHCCNHRVKRLMFRVVASHWCANESVFMTH